VARLPPWLGYGLVILVALVWATGVLVAIFTAADLPNALNLLFSSLIGGLVLGTKPNGGKKEEPR
jgi:hypothetical protein